MPLGRMLLAAVVFAASGPCFAEDPTSLLTSMVGTWDVAQRMWPGPKTEPMKLPAAVAQRQMVRSEYLEETMRAADETGGFVRNTLFNYNPVTSRYEYTSLDTRAPQLMVEQSERMKPEGIGAELKLQGATFVAPEWGKFKNTRFRYRLTVSPVVNATQTVRLYLTPETILPKREFLAFEYVYTKRP